jgi:hypothetical protein
MCVHDLQIAWAAGLSSGRTPNDPGIGELGIDEAVEAMAVAARATRNSECSKKLTASISD